MSDYNTHLILLPPLSSNSKSSGYMASSGMSNVFHICADCRTVKVGDRAESGPAPLTAVEHNTMLA